MKPKIFKADIAGYIVQFDEEDIYYVGGPTEQGMVYKDQKAFDDRVGICYIPEAGFFDNGNEYHVSERMLNYAEKHNESFISNGAGGYTRSDIYDAVYIALDTDDWVADKMTTYGEPFVEGFIDYLSECVFQVVDWQCPETYLNEIDWEEDWDEYVRTNGDMSKVTAFEMEQMLDN